MLDGHGMSKLDRLLDEYDESHRHPLNVAIHWVAEPLAILALMALATSIDLPIGSLLWPFLVVMFGYFAQLSFRVTLAFAPIAVLFIILIGFIDNISGGPPWTWAAPLFGVCWVALLIGHKIEGRVPSVFRNPHLIFIGPVWLIRIAFRHLNLELL
jgi:uncharacterized membrane protein YGL010W